MEDITGIGSVTAQNESVVISKDAQGVFASYNFKASTKVTINIFNAAGQQVGTTQETSVQNKGRFTIKTPELAKGIYMIEMRYNNKTKTKKMDF